MCRRISAGIPRREARGGRGRVAAGYWIGILYCEKGSTTRFCLGLASVAGG